jgi:hypothetical protein
MGPPFLASTGHQVLYPRVKRTEHEVDYIITEVGMCAVLSSLNLYHFVAIVSWPGESVFKSPSKNQLLWDIRGFIQYIQGNTGRVTLISGFRRDIDESADLAERVHSVRQWPRPSASFPTHYSLNLTIVSFDALNLATGNVK